MTLIQLRIYTQISMPSLLNTVHKLLTASKSHTST